LEEVRKNAALQLGSPVRTGSDTATGSIAKLLKLSQVIDQTSDEEARMLSQDEIREAYRQYDIRLGGVPPPDHEPSYEQLSCLAHLKAIDGNPYADMAVYGPHSIRIIRKLKLTGLLLNSSGELFRSELSGPSNYEQWECCYMVYRTALIMLEMVSPAACDLYRDHVKQYNTRYLTGSGQGSCWALIYQSDTRAHRELAERIRRRGQLDFEQIKSSTPEGRPIISEYDPKRPWDYVFRRLPLEFSFWKRELEDSAMLIITKAIRAGAPVSGEVPIAKQPHDHVAEVASLVSPGGSGGRGNSGNQGNKRTRSGEKKAKPTAACIYFNRGGCNFSCPYDHTCSVCGAHDHGARHHCSAPNQSPGKSRGKAGRNKVSQKGKGKSKQM
jgi:hypothetical protein